MKWTTPLALLLVCGCSRGNFSSRTPTRAPGEFIASMGITPTTLDPALSQDTVTNDLLSHVFETLVGWGKTGKLEARLASSWDISSDRLTYTFHLRKGLTFHSGKPVEASDVIWSWNRACDPRIESQLPGDYLGDIDGAKDVIEGKSKEIRGLSAPDSGTLVVRLAAPRASFLGKLTYPIAAPLPRGLLPEGERLDDPAKMIGAGPFKVVRYTPEAEVELEAFDGYFGGQPTVRKLTLRIVKDATTRVNLLKTGRLDWASLPPADVAAFRNDPDFTIQEAERPGTYFVGMNGKIYPPFRDVRIRRAFNHAIDRRRLVDVTLAGYGTPAEGILPPSVPNLARKKPTLEFDPVKARLLVKEAGWEGNLLPLDLYVSDPSGDRRRVGELIASMLHENLGVEVRLKQVESGVLIYKATRRELAFWMGSWFMDCLDAENLLSVAISGYGQNRASWTSSAFDALCRKGDSLPDGPERLKAYADAEDIAIRDAVWIPLYHPREAIAIRKGIRGFESNPLGPLPPTSMSR